MKKILIVEDEPVLQDALNTAFTTGGYEVIKAMDGEEGIRMALEQKPDLVLLDLILPKKNGFEVLESIKKDVATKDIPVLMLTNLEESSEVMKAIELGAQGYLVKANYAIKEVLAKVQSIIG